VSVLLRQPHGFEGFVAVKEDPQTDRESVAELPYLEVPTVDGYPGALGSANVVNDDKHYVRGEFDDPLRLDFEVVLPCAEPSPACDPDGLVPVGHRARLPSAGTGSCVRNRSRPLMT
jgi:hypothetical protein